MKRNDFNNQPYIETIPSEPFDFGPTRAADGNNAHFGASETEVDSRVIQVTEPMSDENVTQIGDVDVNGHMVIATVGWLVGTKGSCRGLDYRLRSGKNYIGRGDASYQVNLDKDLKIHRDGPVVEVIYDSKHREFMLCPGKSSVLGYCNGDALYSPRPIKAYDRIEVGESELMFVPLCGPHFSWEDPQE